MTPPKKSRKTLAGGVCLGLAWLTASSLLRAGDTANVPLHQSNHTLVNTAWDLLRKGVSDGNPDKRREAIKAIAAIGAQPEAMKLLEDALHDKSAPVRQSAAAALGEIKAPESIPYLRQALDDDDEVAFTAAKALASMGDISCQQVFQEVLTGERKDAAGTLKSATRDAQHKMRNPIELAMIGINEASGAFLGPASYGVTAAEKAFRDKGTGRALAASYLAKDPDPYALTLLEWALGDNSAMVRAAAAKALGERGNQSSIDKLASLLKDSRTAVRNMAAASIIRLSANGEAPKAQASQAQSSQPGIPQMGTPSAQLVDSTQK